MLGIYTVSLTAYAEAIVESKLASNPGGPFNYAVFSNTNLIINGSDQIQGSVYSNGQLTLNGTLGITQAAEGAKGVSVTGSNNLGSVGADTLNDISVNGTNTIGSEYGGGN